MIIGVKCHIKHEFSFRSSVCFFKVILLIKKKILIDLTVPGPSCSTWHVLVMICGV